MTAANTDLFDQAMERYRSGAEASELIGDFEAITAAMPQQAAGFTCLSWLQLLCNQPEQALRSARTAVKLNGQDPQARINLCLAMLETKAKGVRDHIHAVQQLVNISPDFAADLKESIADGLQRKPGWPALKKVNDWLEL